MATCPLPSILNVRRWDSDTSVLSGIRYHIGCRFFMGNKDEKKKTRELFRKHCGFLFSLFIFVCRVTFGWNRGDGHVTHYAYSLLATSRLVTIKYKILLHTRKIHREDVATTWGQPGLLSIMSQLEPRVTARASSRLEHHVTTIASSQLDHHVTARASCHY